MATKRAIPRSPVPAAVLVAMLVLALGVPGPAGAQRGGPPAPPPAPRNPLALDSNPRAVPLAPPVNDNFDQALTIPGLTYYYTEDTGQATTQTLDPSQSCTTTGQNSHSVWFKYTPTSTATLFATTYGSNYDTVLSFHTGTWGALTEVVCNDDASSGVVYSQLSFTPVAGVTYYIDITSWDSTGGGSLAFVLRTSAPPPNDDFAQAITVPLTLPYTATVDATNATIEPEDPIQGLGAQSGDCVPSQNDISVWYKYTALSATPLTAMTYGSSYDTVISAHNGTWPSLTQVACNDNQNNTLQSQISFTPTAGTTYYFDVTRDRIAIEPPYDLLTLQLVNGAPPPNDNFAAARTIGATPYSDSVNAAYATLESSDPAFPCSGPPAANSRTVWYRYVPATSVVLIIDTFGSAYDTVLAVWTGTSPGTLSAVECNDDYGGLQSRVTAQTQAGMTYYIEIASKGTSAAGQMVLNVRPYAPQWQTRAPLALGRDRLAAAGNGTYLYLVGGERYVADAPDASYEPTNVLSRYDPATNLWTDLQPMPVALQDHKAVYVGGKIYVPSGYAGSGPPFYGTQLVYDIAGNSWSTAASAPWPSGRPPVYYGLASDGQGYYLTGGYDGAGILANVWYYRIATNTWTARSPMPVPRFGHESAFFGGYLYVVAGDNDATLPGLFSTMRYDPAANAWISVASQNYDRLFAGSGVLPAAGSPGKWYLTGGGFSSYGYGGPLGATEVFDPVAGAWTLLPMDYDLLEPRYFLASGTRANELYTFGGYIGGVPGIVNTTERLTVALPTGVTVTGVTAQSPPAMALAAAALLGAVAAMALARRRTARRRQ